MLKWFGFSPMFISVLMSTAYLAGCSTDLKMSPEQIEWVKADCLTATPESTQPYQTFCQCYAESLAEFCDYSSASKDTDPCFDAFEASGRDQSCQKQHVPGWAFSFRRSGVR